MMQNDGIFNRLEKSLLGGKTPKAKNRKRRIKGRPSFKNGYEIVWPPPGARNVLPYWEGHGERIPINYSA